MAPATGLWGAPSKLFCLRWGFGCSSQRRDRHRRTLVLRARVHSRGLIFGRISLMDRAAKNLAAWLAFGGLVGCTLVVEDQSHEDQPHAEYGAPSTNVIIAPSGSFSNVSAQNVIWSYHPTTLSLEWLIRHDHLVVQTAELTPPAEQMFGPSVPRTGSDPFFQRRPHPSNLDVAVPKISPFWCSSFQKFRPRRA